MAEDNNGSVKEVLAPKALGKGFSNFMKNYTLVFAWLVGLTLWLIFTASSFSVTLGRERMSSEDPRGMWGSGGEKMKYMCMDLPGREHCGPGEAFTSQKRHSPPAFLRSRFLNERSIGPDPTVDADVMDYYSGEVGTGETATREFLGDRELLEKLKGK